METLSWWFSVKDPVDLLKFLCGTAHLHAEVNPWKWIKVSISTDMLHDCWSELICIKRNSSANIYQRTYCVND